MNEIVCHTIRSWDWRYRVGFDLDLREEVRISADSLPDSPERVALLGILEWGSSFVSLGAVIESIQDGSTTLADLRSIDREKLLFIPEELVPGLRDKIASLDSGPLGELLDASQRAPFRELQRLLFEATFGRELDHLLATAEQVAYQPAPEPVAVTPQDLETAATRFQRDLLSTPEISSLLKAYPFPEFDTEIVEGRGGYAEYWPRELVPGSQVDKLVLHKSEALMDRDTLQSTLFHEVYPGHGLFYGLVANRRPPFFDHGAITLVEGWATWCEWTFHDSAYARHTRSTRSRFLRTFDMTNPDEIIAQIDTLRAERRALDSREDQLNLFFLYPGFASSYALGALWFEKHLSVSNAAPFLNAIMMRPIGDFFRAWSEPGVTSFTGE